MSSTVADLTKWAKLVGTGALISPELQAERLKWDRLGDNDDNWHYTFGLEENSGWIGHNGQIPGYFTFEVYNPALDATIVIAMNSDKKVNGEQGINVLLRDISKILFPNNPRQRARHQINIRRRGFLATRSASAREISRRFGPQRVVKSSR